MYYNEAKLVKKHKKKEKNHFPKKTCTFPDSGDIFSLIW